MTPELSALLEGLKAEGFSLFEGADGVLWLSHPTYGGGWLSIADKQADIKLVDALARLEADLLLRFCRTFIQSAYP